MVEVILPRRATFVSSLRANGGRRRVPVSLLLSPRKEGHVQPAKATEAPAELLGLSPAEVTAAMREQRRLEMERELCEKLGLQTPEVSPVARPKLTTTPKAPQTARPTSAGPSRPPKPKKHRPLPEATGSFHAPVSAEELPSVRRWKSSALEAPWLGEDKTETPQSSPLTSPKVDGQASLTGLCIEINLPPAPSLEASPASAGVEVESPEAEASPAAEASHPNGGPPESGESPGAESNVQGTGGAKLLEEGSRRLRENLQRLRLENRRHRVRPVAPSELVGLPSQAPEEDRERFPKFEELRRKIRALEEASWAEEQRLRLEEKEVQERREKQEAFERSLQEQMERQLRELREREAREAEEQAAREEEARQHLEERQSRRKMQLEQEEQRSRQLEEQRLGRFEASAQGPFSDDLEQKWEEQAAEERRRVEDYARFRRRQFEEWERHFAAERLRFASAAEFCAASVRQRAKQRARADEAFYAEREMPWHKTDRPTPEEGDSRDSHLAPEERQVVKELRSVLGAPRETQKAKVKDLLIRLHPDKNPGCTDKAKQLFQFLQEQRRAVLGL